MGLYEAGIRAVAAMLVAGLGACASLPPVVERTPTQAYTDTGSTQLGRAVSADAAGHPGRSAVHAVPVGRDAFAVRYALARAAQRSIDVQYYIWHPDTSGGLLAHELWQAAERGVRVRVLLDDHNTRGMDEAIAALDAHPNVEVRLLATPRPRRCRALSYGLMHHAGPSRSDRLLQLHRRSKRSTVADAMLRGASPIGGST